MAGERIAPDPARVYPLGESYASGHLKRCFFCQTLLADRGIAFDEHLATSSPCKARYNAWIKGAHEDIHPGVQETRHRE